MKRAAPITALLITVGCARPHVNPGPTPASSCGASETRATIGSATIVGGTIVAGKIGPIDVDPTKTVTKIELNDVTISEATVVGVAATLSHGASISEQGALVTGVDIEHVNICGYEKVRDERGVLTLRGGVLVSDTTSTATPGPEGDSRVEHVAVRHAKLVHVTINGATIKESRQQSGKVLASLVNGRIIAGTIEAGEIDGLVENVGSIPTRVRIEGVRIASATVAAAVRVPLLCPSSAGLLGRGGGAPDGCIPRDTTSVAFESPAQGFDATAPLPPPVTGVRDVYIDGRTGAVVKGLSTTFETGEFVRVVVINVNPFLFKYKIVAGTAQTIQEASPLNFLSLALGQASATPTPQGLTVPPSDGVTVREKSEPDFAFHEGADSLAVRGRSPSCDSSQQRALLARLQGPKARIEVMGKNIDRSLALWTRDSTYGQFQDHVSAILDARLSASEVRKLAYLADQEARRLAAVAAESDNLTNGDVAHYQSALDSLITQIKETKLQGTCPAVTQVLTAAEADSQQAAAYAVTLTQVVAKESVVNSLGPQFASVWTDASRFWAMLTVSRQDANGDIVVTIERSTIPQPKPSPNGSAGSHATGNYTFSINGTVTSGSQGAGSAAPAATSSTRLSAPSIAPGAGQNGSTPNGATTDGANSQIAAVPDSAYSVLAQPILHYRSTGFLTVGIGAFYTPLAAPQFGVQQRRVAAPPGAPGDSVINQIVATSNSGGRIVPAATMSLLFPKGFKLLGTGIERKVMPSIVIGASILPQSGAAYFGLIAGAGLNVLQGKLAFVSGVYVSTQDYLTGGYHVGDEVVGSATTAPVASHTKTAFTIGASYRVY